MKIILARTAGFCMGVRRAMEIAIDAMRNEKGVVYTQGPLIHNHQAVELLKARGIEPAAADDTAGLPLIVRAHGISPAEREQLAAQGCRLTDATCPHVLLSQSRIEKAGEQMVVLVGDPDHPEIAALAGSAEKECFVISSVAEAEEISPEKEFIVIAQTTFHKGLYEEITAVLRRRFPSCKVFDSICAATETRQQDAREIALRADCLVVVGGRHSANTKRLADIGREVGKPVFHVETAEELDAADFIEFTRVGVTAGASTPGWLTEQVIDRLESFGRGGFLWYLVRLLARARLTTAAGAAALCYAISVLMGLPSLRWEVMVISALFVFFSYTLNRRSPPEEATRELVPMDSFYNRHRYTLNFSALFGMFICLGLAWRVDPFLFIIMAVAHCSSVLYLIPFLPAGKRLKDLPASKDVAVAAAWCLVLLGGIVVASGGGLGWKQILGSGGIVFLVVFAKTVMLDLRDMEGDHLVGIETLPTLIGRRRAIRLLYIVDWGLMILLGCLGLSGLTSLFALLLALVPLYGLVSLYLLVRLRFRGEVNCQLVVDCQLIFAGILALCWSAL